MSLKKFNIFFILISLLVMTLFYLYIARLLQNNIDTQVQNSVRSSGIELRQQLYSNFNLIEQRFVHYEEVSLLKLKEVAQSVDKNTTTETLVSLSSILNHNVYDGHYEIYLIDENKKVIESTSKGDVGLDYNEYPYFSKALDKLQEGTIEYKISAPTYDEYALDIAQYYVVATNDGQWVMIGFVLPFDDYIHTQPETLNDVFPALKQVDLFILTYDSIQHINTQAHKIKDFKTAGAEKEYYANMMMKDLSLEKRQDSGVIESIAGFFSEQNMVQLLKVDDESEVYTLVDSSFENSADDFMFIAKLTFDHEYFRQGYDELKNLMHLFVSFIFLFILFAFIIIYSFVIKKVSAIVYEMQSDEAIKIEGFMFSEFKFFVKRYNSFLLRWQEEVHRLNDITLTDELTQCANRRHFNQIMKSQIDLFKRYQHPFSMIMYDIDDFKAINDSYGHTQGDTVLTKMSEDVRQHLRSSDILCRIGGEEFAIILPDTDEEAATVVASKIRETIEKHIYIDKQSVTISLGVSEFTGGHNFNSFYSSTDQLLYQAKNSGKNCVVSRKTSKK